MTVLIIAFVLAALYVLSTRCRHGHKGLQALCGHGYAHRGLHGEGVPENSMTAFQRAKEGGYGVELDVHLMKDGELAVIHDAKLLRTTGAPGVIEDLTVADLPQYKLEGTEETIPVFSDVLKLFDGKVPIILELKCQDNNYAALCQKACDMMDNYNGPYCMESFDPRCIRWLRKNRPDVIRGQLTENYFKGSAAKLPWVLKFVLVNQILNFLLLPDFIAYRYKDRKHFSNFLTEKLWGCQSVTWTLTAPEQYETAVKEGRIPIFEGFLPK
ncbi:MAG: glycerophosphodiester phosphodiesterase [Oscillospiraceae bacterium]|nr:glycerophosphodiester phosphodiesterase [Oscillospiraceae bacterium]